MFDSQEGEEKGHFPTLHISQDSAHSFNSLASHRQYLQPSVLFTSTGLRSLSKKIIGS